jgi:cryptochrome
MFDFPTQRDICMEGMKTAYHIGLHGNDPKVLDGTWKQLFDDDAEGPTKGDKGGPGGLDSWDDADGTEEHHGVPTETPKNSKASSKVENKAAASPRAPRGHKREHSQGTLDGAFTKRPK